MKFSKKVVVSFLSSCVLVSAMVSVALAEAGHSNVAAIGTAASNKHFGVSYQSTYRLGDNHAQVAVLKKNLISWRAYGDHETRYFSGVAKITSTDNKFDQATLDNLKVFQKAKGLTADGIYGQQTRNVMHAAIGSSPKGFVRLKDTAYYINYNDTSDGLAADATYRLDHSYVTPTTKTRLDNLAQKYFAATSQKLQINDASLIDGADTPEHSTHQRGIELDIRSSPMTVAQQKKFLELCKADPTVTKVIFHTSHGVFDESDTKDKFSKDAGHSTHFHIEF